MTALLDGVNVLGSGTVWNIPHNLGTTEVAVDVTVNNAGDDEKIMPVSIEVVDANNLKITFSASQSGQVRVVGGGD